MNQEDIVNQLTTQLKKELPVHLTKNIDVFLELVYKKDYRRAYLILDDVKKEPNWRPSKLLLELFEKFWWDLAN